MNTAVNSVSSTPSCPGTKKSRKATGDSAAPLSRGYLPAVGRTRVPQEGVGRGEWRVECGQPCLHKPYPHCLQDGVAVTFLRAFTVLPEAALIFFPDFFCSGLPLVDEGS